MTALDKSFRKPIVPMSDSFINIMRIVDREQIFSKESSRPEYYPKINKDNVMSNSTD